MPQNKNSHYKSEAVPHPQNKNAVIIKHTPINNTPQYTKRDSADSRNWTRSMLYEQKDQSGNITNYKDTVTFTPRYKPGQRPKK